MADPRTLDAPTGGASRIVIAFTIIRRKPVL
jgi:hypothetical protein